MYENVIHTNPSTMRNAEGKNAKRYQVKRDVFLFLKVAIWVDY